MSEFRTRLCLNALEARDVPAAGLDDVFNGAQYLADNPDVAAAVRAGAVTAEDHFRRIGQFENRNAGGFFDTKAYLEDNPDVRDAVSRRGISALDHFLKNGQFEDRNPNRFFDAKAYLAANPDVAAAVRGGRVTAFQHFVENGQFEDRVIGPTFNVGVYLDDNPDVRDAVQRGVLKSGTEHFVRSGIREGRGKPIVPSGTLTQAVTTFDGTSANSADRKYFSFAVPTTRAVQIQLSRVGGDFAKLELENSAGVDVFELEPKNGISTGTVILQGNSTYILRVRAANDAAAQFRVTLTQL